MNKTDPSNIFETPLFGIKIGHSRLVQYWQIHSSSDGSVEAVGLYVRVLAFDWEILE